MQQNYKFKNTNLLEDLDYPVSPWVLYNNLLMLEEQRFLLFQPQLWRLTLVFCNKKLGTKYINNFISHLSQSAFKFYFRDNLPNNIWIFIVFTI